LQTAKLCVKDMNIKATILLFLFLTGLCQADEPLSIARVSLDEATRKILQDSNKRVLGARTEIIDGREVHIIKVLTPDGHIHYYKIDAETGAIAG